MQHSLTINDQILLADGAQSRASAVAYMLTKVRQFITATPEHLPAFVWCVDAALLHGEQEFRTQNMHAVALAKGGFGDIRIVEGTIMVKLFPSFVHTMAHIRHHNPMFMREVIELMLTYAQIGSVEAVAPAVQAVCDAVYAHRQDRVATVVRARLPFAQAMLAIWLTLDIPLTIVWAPLPASRRFESQG